MALLGLVMRLAVIPPEVSNKTFHLISGDTRRHSRRGLIRRSRRWSRCGLIGRSRIQPPRAKR
jgi:hypothetical protein